MSKIPGTIYLVGAGPGDPGLITQKGLELIRRAEIIFYDNLVNPLLLNEAKEDCQKIDVGKRGEGNSTDQKIIEEQLIKAAQKFSCIVRLKGGDPFIFGRGGEEAERLAREKIPYEIVPGVSSAMAVPAYAGIPLTHRNFTSSVAFVTGRVGAVREPPLQDIDWNALAKIGTLVFLMSVKTLRQNMQNLIEAGRDPQTPAAIIRWGTYPKQETLIGSISNIAEEVEKRKLMPPGIVVVGDVVNLREQIAWFEKKPLFGKNILVTRARSQASELVQKLQTLGAEVVECPVLEILPPNSWKKMDTSIRNIQKYDWLIFTSVNGVHFFFSRFGKLKKDIRDLAKCKIAAVGPATAQALEALHLKVEKIPSEFNAKKLGMKFGAKEVKGKKILFPRAEKGREDLPYILTEKGAKLDLVTAYRTCPPKNSRELVSRLEKIAKIDAISFTSSSTVEHFKNLLSPSLFEKMRKIPAICIGPETLQKARQEEFLKLSRAGKSTLASLMDKILEVLA